MAVPLQAAEPGGDTNAARVQGANTRAGAARGEGRRGGGKGQEL